MIKLYRFPHVRIPGFTQNMGAKQEFDIPSDARNSSLETANRSVAVPQLE
jgi:hypothetical protein